MPVRWMYEAYARCASWYAAFRGAVGSDLGFPSKYGSASLANAGALANETGAYFSKPIAEQKGWNFVGSGKRRFSVSAARYT